MKQIVLAVTLAACAVPALAQEIFLCVDSQGRKEYKNNGATRGCKRVDLPNVTTLPAPQPRAAAAPRRAEAQGNAAAQAAATAPATAAPAASGPADFPKVDTATQKARDSDRRQILQEELRAESAKLAEMRKEFNNGEPERRGDERNYVKYQERVAQMRADIGRVQQNVDALTRELANQR